MNVSWALRQASEAPELHLVIRRMAKQLLQMERCRRKHVKHFLDFYDEQILAWPNIRAKSILRRFADGF